MTTETPMKQRSKSAGQRVVASASMRPYRRRIVAMALAALAIGAYPLIRCTALPSLDNRSVSKALLSTGDTRLGRALSPFVKTHPGKAGIYPLRNPRDAFAARICLTQLAEKTLDVQYYIWQNDLSGKMMFRALQKAADRGVRVRLLLDDNNTKGLDAMLRALDAHPNIEVRLFNPFVYRRFRPLGYVTDPLRLNRRMHNKSFTGDNQVTIVGGRNIGDEYFGVDNDVLMADLDVIAAGPVVNDVSNSFDAYWASDSAYPVDRILPPLSPTEASQVDIELAQVDRDPQAVEYQTAVKRSIFVKKVDQKTLPLQWTTTHMVSDDPAKGLGRASKEALLATKLKTIFGHPSKQVLVISPYFVLRKPTARWFTDMATEGVTMKVLTNSLEATDVALVHAGYIKRRKLLLKGGVQIFEFKLLSGRSGINQWAGSRASSRSSLHAKSFAVDGKSVFIGSFNFDPRSAQLNTEMGFIIDSPTIARQMEAIFKDGVYRNAYAVRLADNGTLEWIEHKDGKEIRHPSEPGVSRRRRAAVFLFSLLPIEWLL